MDIDVTDTLGDSYIAGDPFLVIRRQQKINNFGENVSQPPQRFDAVGAIVPTGHNSLVREDAYQTGLKSIKVVTQFLLRLPTKEATEAEALQYEADIIVWKGDSYVVKTLNDYSQYGAGFVEAECVSVDYIDQAPTDQVS